MKLPIFAACFLGILFLCAAPCAQANEEIYLDVYQGEGLFPQGRTYTTPKDTSRINKKRKRAEFDLMNTDSGDLEFVAGRMGHKNSFKPFNGPVSAKGSGRSPGAGFQIKFEW